MKNKGTTFIETIISMFVLSIFIIPAYKSLVFFKGEFRNIKMNLLVEKELEKARYFYLKERFEKNMKSIDTRVVLDKNKIKLSDDMNKIVLKIKYKDKIKKECIIYVYDQK